METNVSPELIVGIIAALIVTVVVIRFAKQIATFLLVAGGIVAVIVVGWALLKQGQATEEAAQAVTVASSGQATASVGVTVLATLLVLVLIAGGIGIAYLVWRLRRAEWMMQRQTGQWMPGPNALWGQRDDVSLQSARISPDTWMMALMSQQMTLQQLLLQQQLGGRVPRLSGHQDVYTQGDLRDYDLLDAGEGNATSPGIFVYDLWTQEEEEW